jgi:hypothetical protein
MKTTDENLRRPERRLSLDPREDRVLTLSLAYLGAGLTAEDALDSACADFASADEAEPWAGARR